MKNKILSFAALATMIVFSSSAQQLKIPAASPLQTIKQNFGLSDITIEYSRPSAKGRVVFGEVVPFGKIWRTGANASTKITFGENVLIGADTVKAGTYAIYTVPNKDSWDIMFNKDATLGGNVAKYKTETEVLRFKAKPTLVSSKMETFTIDFANLTSNSLDVLMQWENTAVSFKVMVNEDGKIMKDIDVALSPDDKRPYFQAANYYFENDKDLNKALEWSNKAIEQNPKAYYMVHLKAKIQLKLKDYDGAIATAQKSIALAKEDKNEEYVSRNEKLIAEANKKGK